MSEVLCPYCGGEMRHVATTWSDAEYYECKGCHSRSPSANCMKVKEAALTRKDSPVVHARWVHEQRCGDSGGWVWRCTACRREAITPIISALKYCHACGAKMDAKEEV